MSRLIAGAAVVGVAAIGIGHTTESAPGSTVCEHCGCESPPSTHPGVVNIDADYGGDTVFGTGIVLTPTGEILTSDHVIRDTTGICVTTEDRSYPATVIGMDPDQDIAMIQIQGATDLATAPLGDSSAVDIGDDVTVLGNDEDPAADSGDVTAVSRTAVITGAGVGESKRFTGLIEIDTEIPPGDSGGPLLNAEGQVIGVNTAGTRRLGLAVPINKALALVAKFRKTTQP